MNLFRAWRSVASVTSTLVAFVCIAVGAPATQTLTINEAYPNLAAESLVHARLGQLGKGLVLQSGSLRITEDDLKAEMLGAPAEMKTELEKNLFFLLEQKATKSLLAQMAGSPANATPADERAKIQQHLQKIVGDIQVADADINQFYQENKEMFSGATQEQIKGELKQYVLQQKQQEAVSEHIRSLGKRVPISVSADWAKRQAALAMDNPVDKARASGKPALVDFGAEGCGPCDMMTPILASLKTKYEGKMGVHFIQVREQQILAARYGIQSIPVQVLFDKTGREVWRHTGFIPQAQLEAEIAKMGLE